MAEEHGFQSPEGHRLCANNCGFFGSPATMNLCSKCYRDVRLNEQEAATTKSTIENALSSSTAASSLSSTGPSLSSASPAIEPLPHPVAVKPVEIALNSTSEATGPVSQPNRCATCRKRVGLTGFKCRCGVTFCGAHRYSEIHGCSFDFKTVGREEIARANPLIKAEKLEKI